jgi:hypothetical protein
MLAPSGKKPVAGGPCARVSALGTVLPAPPTSLGACVETSDAGNWLFSAEGSRWFIESARRGTEEQRYDPGKALLRTCGKKALLIPACWRVVFARQHYVGHAERWDKLDLDR